MEKLLHLPVAVGQFPLTLDIMQNLRSIQHILQQAAPGELVVLPEGAVSGYSEDLSFLIDVDIHLLDGVLDTLAGMVMERCLHLVVGSCLWQQDQWWNAAIYFAPDGQRCVYHKVNLAIHEREYMSAGSTLPVFPMYFEQGQITAGIQLCREIRYPEQWRYLAIQNIDVFIYLTNAINPTVPPTVWRSHLVSRAAENQRFLLSANVAHPLQHCPTMIIAPDGEVLSEAEPEQTSILHATLDLRRNASWYLNQCRTDVVGVLHGNF